MHATDTLIVLDAFKGNNPTRLFWLQEILAPYVPHLEALWSSAFVITLGVALYVGILRPALREYRKR